MEIEIFVNKWFYNNFVLWRSFYESVNIYDCVVSSGFCKYCSPDPPVPHPPPPIPDSQLALRFVCLQSKRRIHCAVIVINQNGYMVISNFIVLHFEQTCDIAQIFTIPLGFKNWRHRYLTNQTSRCEFWSEYGRHGR